MTPPQTLDNRQYKCNRAANSKAFNSPHLLQKQVPKILKCRNVRGNESEREEGLACGADQNEPTRTRKLMGFDSSLNERCAARISRMIGPSSRGPSRVVSGGADQGVDEGTD